MSSLRLALRFARRELRGGFAGFRIFFLCLVLGSAAIAGVESLSSAFLTGLQDQGQVLLGGDVSVQLVHRAAGGDDPIAAWTDTLEGGDVARGRELFFTKGEVSCVRCHRAEGKGGDYKLKDSGALRRAAKLYKVEEAGRSDEEVASELADLLAALA